MTVKLQTLSTDVSHKDMVFDCEVHVYLSMESLSVKYVAAKILASIVILEKKMAKHKNRSSFFAQFGRVLAQTFILSHCFQHIRLQMSFPCSDAIERLQN